MGGPKKVWMCGQRRNPRILKRRLGSIQFSGEKSRNIRSKPEYIPEYLPTQNYEIFPPAIVPWPPPSTKAPLSTRSNASSQSQSQAVTSNPDLFPFFNMETCVSCAPLEYHRTSSSSSFIFLPYFMNYFLPKHGQFFKEKTPADENFFVNILSQILGHHFRSF